MSTLRDLRPHQLTALDGLKASLRSGCRRPMLQAPTGAGKTVIAAHIVHGAHAKGNRVTFCVPSISLVDQTFERFVENGIDPALMGVIQADHPWKRPDAPIQIATAQTLARRDIPETDVVVIDEAHVRFKVYERWMAESDVPFIGLSATPWAKGLGVLFDDLIRPTSTADLIEAGYLSPFRVFAPSSPDLTGIKVVAGDYHEGQLGERMNQPHLVADVVTTWLMRANGLPTLCFAVNRVHAKSLHDRFAEAGVSVAYIDANTPREEREDIGKRLASGDVQVVCNIGCLTTGIDWDVRCLILARPTKSESLFVQIIGRALRTAPGKDFALVLDHSDTHLRLGMVTDIDHDHLDTGTKEDKDAKRKDHDPPLPKECNACGCLVPATMKECPACGTERQLPMLYEADGDLEELGARKGRPASVRDMIAAMGKTAVYMQLAGYADERGRKPGWISHTYREVFGVWPKGMPEDVSVDPTPVMRSWLRSRDIAFAKARDRRTGGHDHAV